MPGQAGAITVEILHIDDCPNWREATTRVRAALETIDRGVTTSEVEFIRIADRAQLRDLPFAGSPTILVNGRDLFPSDGATDDLACRVYLSQGRLVALPTVGELVDALRTRRASDAEG